jgi:hypothetical protein
MGQPHTQPPENGPALEMAGLILSANSGGLARLPPEAELSTMRQMMETLFSRIDTLQQNQARQFAGVHDRLDAVELELPLIQEQSALRIRDLESRMTVEIEEAARSAVEEAASGLQEEVAGKFGSLAAQIESQRKELSHMRESRKEAESKLNRVVEDIERLCGSLAPAPRLVEEKQPVIPETPASPFRTRIAEHIKRAAVDAAPDESNPLIGDPTHKKPVAGTLPVGPQPVSPRFAARTGDLPSSVGKQSVESVKPASPAATVNVPFTAHSPAKPAARTSPAIPVATPATARVAWGTADGAVPGFDSWKRQFMQDGEPPAPALVAEPDGRIKSVICPRCYSERTRPASAARLDGIFRLAGYSPYRCRSCTNRFYKRGMSAGEIHVTEEHAEARTEETVDSR